jgi:hypothetical protein
MISLMYSARAGWRGLFFLDDGVSLPTSTAGLSMFCCAVARACDVALSRSGDGPAGAAAAETEEVKGGHKPASLRRRYGAFLYSARAPNETRCRDRGEFSLF